MLLCWGTGTALPVADTPCLHLGSYHPGFFSSSYRKIMNYFSQISKLKKAFVLRQLGDAVLLFIVTLTFI